MSATFHRRKFLTSVMGIPTAGMLMSANTKDEYKKRIKAKGLKTSLNAYSFNKPLTDGSMSIDELIEFCSVGTEADTDLNKLINMIKASDYRGYLPIETLGEGDPKIKVKALFEKIQKALS